MIESGNRIPERAYEPDSPGVKAWWDALHEDMKQSYIKDFKALERNMRGGGQYPLFDPWLRVRMSQHEEGRISRDALH